jgi:membrane protease YdiL (CAAX protease family)
MHAMVAISLLVEGGAVVTALMLLVLGRNQIALASATGYALCAVLVALGTSWFLSNRYVAPVAVWNWTDAPSWDPNDLDTPTPPDVPWWQRWRLGEKSLIPHLLIGVAGGVILGIFAHYYQAALLHIPYTAELLRKSRETMAKVPGMKFSYVIIAVGFAPFAEEYLFRGLLYRALDREWGGRRAVLANAGFFAVYHQPLAWLPVALLGVTNAVLFKRTGRLAPAVLLHMTYNAVVILS